MSEFTVEVTNGKDVWVKAGSTFDVRGCLDLYSFYLICRHLSKDFIEHVKH